MRSPEKMIIYNLFPLLAGKFSDWGKHLIRASELKFNWIFVNPIQCPGFSDSIYSIKDYFSFNPLLVEDDNAKETHEEQVRKVCHRAKDLGMKMMIDLVINHCAIDSDLIKGHPEWFKHERGKVAHPFCFEDKKKVVWGDLASFDHKQTKDPEGLFRFFLKIIDFLAGLGFKGFRCDAAYQVPSSLWKRLIYETKAKYPDTLFFAETLGCTADQTRDTARAGFDYIFNSVKWWDFYSPWLLEQYNLTRDIAPSVGFPESHDTMRLFEELGGNIEGIKQRYLFSALFSAGVMMPIGFEFGFRKKLHVVKTRPEDWEQTNIDLTDFISKVNGIKSKYKIFQEDAPTQILSCANPNILVMWKASTHTKEESLILLNKDIYNKQLFYDDLYRFIQSKAALVDVSPEYFMEYLPTPFHYELRPGQAIVLVTRRN